MNARAGIMAVSVAAWVGTVAAQAPASLPGIEPLPPGEVAHTSGWQGPMTYVQQSHGTCWAATALMLVRAYGGEASLFDLVGGMGEWVVARDDGGGAYGLPNTARPMDDWWR
ncbi:MAG: hypothetical protein IPK27_19155 [Rhodanobacteraceae bacterium]|nr:hypothetical protein [Rhodanobacteraceae bacterium]